MAANIESLFWIPLLPLLGALINLAFGYRMGRKAVHAVGVGSVAAAFVVSVFHVAGPLWHQFHLWHEGQGVSALHQSVYTWIEAGRLRVELAFLLDTLSGVMILTVTFVGTLIHMYSTGYMSHEPRYAAYFGYLNLFTGAMLILVLGDSLPVMFIGWEGVGLCSYLLIGFWFEKTEYANAGRKAFVVNRIGDFAFLLGMFLLIWQVGGVDYASLRSEEAISIYQNNIWGSNVALFACVLLFIGACGKSAQIPLYVWLPDAMAGPTPVSALIHAATMVTAGVYMVARLSFLFMSSATAMALVCGIGALTALVAAFMAFAQTDLKKVLAYSTVSQLGFMFVAVGAGAYAAGVFHLVTHAFFKAGLFLGAGSVMHAMSGSGDIMKMGGLNKLLPRTRLSFAIYCWAIAGLPLLSGFFSKDEILLGAFTAHGEGWLPGYGSFLWVILSLAAVGTAFYMYRLYGLVFLGDCRADEETKSHIHESPASMTIPLLVLAGCTCLLGLIGLPHFLGLPNLIEHWLDPAVHYLANGKPSLLADYPRHVIENGALHAYHASFAISLLLMAAATVLAIVGSLAARNLYKNGVSPWVMQFTTTSFGKKVHRQSLHKLFVDEGYEKYILRPFRFGCRAAFLFFDRFVIDGLLVGGVALVCQIFGQLVSYFQNGKVHRYLTVLLVGTVFVLLVSWRHGSGELTVQRLPSGQVELRATPGWGPESTLTEIEWDFDGDGRADAIATDAKHGIDNNNKARIQRVFLDPHVEHTVTAWCRNAMTGTTKTLSATVPKYAAASSLEGVSR